MCAVVLISAYKEKIMLNEKTNLKIIKLIPEMYNSNPELADRIFDHNCIHHVNGTTEAGKGPDVIKNSLAMMGKQFTDSKTTFLEIISRADAVAVRWVWEAVNIQTQKKWTFNGNTIFHFKNGKIMEYWAIDDRMREMIIHGFTLTPPK
jgi:predicted ester cyclase